MRAVSIIFLTLIICLFGINIRISEASSGSGGITVPSSNSYSKKVCDKAEADLMKFTRKYERLLSAHQAYQKDLRKLFRLQDRLSRAEWFVDSNKKLRKRSHKKLLASNRASASQKAAAELVVACKTKS